MSEEDKKIYPHVVTDNSSSSDATHEEDFYQAIAWRFLRECVFAYWGEVCLKCRSTSGLHVDHVIPRSKAVHLSLDFHNLQPLCERCNVEKSNKSCADYRDPARLNPSNEKILFALAVRRKRACEPWIWNRKGPIGYRPRNENAPKKEAFK